MGSSSSKASSSSSSTTTSSLSSREGTDRSARSGSRRVFQSYCLGATSRSHESDNDDEVGIASLLFYFSSLISCSLLLILFIK